MFSSWVALIIFLLASEDATIGFEAGLAKESPKFFEADSYSVRFQFTSDQMNEEPDERLMVLYGESLRASYRLGDASIVTNPDFLRLEEELASRNLVTRDNISEIERGIVYVGMPLSQALASIDGLTEVDALVLNRHVIRSFQGINFARLGSITSRDTFISCDGIVVSLFAARGLITAETYNFSFGSGRIRFQTNFRPNFWEDENFEDRIRGNRIAEAPTYFANSRENRWSIFLNNSGTFMKPSVWRDTGATSFQPHIDQININDQMNAHIRRGGSVC